MTQLVFHCIDVNGTKNRFGLSYFYDGYNDNLVIPCSHMIGIAYNEKSGPIPF